MSAADLKDYFQGIYKKKSSVKFKEPTLKLSDKRNLWLWELVQRYGKTPGITIIGEPMERWPASRVRDFDALTIWDAWAAQAPLERLGVAARMTAMADWMREKKW